MLFLELLEPLLDPYRSRGDGESEGRLLIGPASEYQCSNLEPEVPRRIGKLQAFVYPQQD